VYSSCGARVASHVRVVHCSEYALQQSSSCNSVNTSALRVSYNTLMPLLLLLLLTHLLQIVPLDMAPT
jgi:hypothetical protein